MIDADVHECWACVHKNCGCDTWCEYGEAFELREDVKNAPTIEAVPVMHGEWIFNQYYTWECGNCGFHPFKGFIPKEPGFNFCPNCGADMRKKV